MSLSYQQLVKNEEARKALEDSSVPEQEPESKPDKRFFVAEDVPVEGFAQPEKNSPAEADEKQED